MQGKILNFDVINDTGIISDVNGRRYNFSSKDWKDSMKFPKEGLLVSFEQSGRDADNIYVIDKLQKASPIKNLILENLNKLGFFLVIISTITFFAYKNESNQSQFNKINNGKVSLSEALSFEGELSKEVWDKYYSSKVVMGTNCNNQSGNSFVKYCKDRMSEIENELRIKYQAEQDKFMAVAKERQEKEEKERIRYRDEPTTDPTDFKEFGLIPSESKKHIKDKRTNPFSLIPIEPSKIPSKTPSPKIKKYLTYSKGDFETENIFLSIMLRESVDLDRSPELIGKIRNSDLEQFSEGRSMLEDALNKSYVACDEYMKERNETHKTYLELLNDLPSEESKKSAEIIINNLCPSLK